MVASPQSMTIEEAIIHTRLSELFEVWHKNQPERTGIHVSSLIASDAAFCFRQIVLMQFHKHQDINLHGRTLQIFLQGWVIHQKWQELFRTAGNTPGSFIEVLSIEESRVKKGITYTPDIIAAIGTGKLGKPYIIEIKSMKGERYEALKGIHKDARVQANMYMWLEGIEQAIVLVENKDTQEFKLWVIKYDKPLVQKYINRAIKVRRMNEEYREKEVLPPQHVMCPSLAAAKASRCPVRDACFAGRNERRKMLNG